MKATDISVFFLDTPICNINTCLLRDQIWCVSDLHEVTPNNHLCKRKIIKEEE